MKNTYNLQRQAFSLVELLVVVAVIAIIAGFAVPAVTTMIRGSQLSQASQAVTDQLALARQLALSRNRSVEVRFYRFSDPETPGEDPKNPDAGFFRAIQIFEVLDNGAALPINNMQRMPTNVIINDGKFSTVIAETAERPWRVPTGSDPLMPDKEVGNNYKYVALRFLPDGSTDLSPIGTKDGDSWFLTLHGTNEKDSGKTDLPANYFTLQIDPVNGSTRAYRPNAG